MKSEEKNSFKWSLLIQFSTQVTQFGVSVFLARILFPKDFGYIGMISVFIAIGKLITDGALGQSLIRTKDPDNDDYSTVFVFSIVTAIFLYGLLFLIAPYISYFFEEPVLTQIIRIFSLSIVFTALSTVQSIKLNKALQFKTQFKLLFPSILVSSGFAIWMAYNGYGVWSLVAKELIFSIFATIQLWFYGGWTPSIQFNSQKFTHHFGFSSNLLATGILSVTFNNSFNIVIGKLYNASQLGLFTRSKSISILPRDFIFNAINRVMFPLLAQMGENNKELKASFRKIYSLMAYLLIPISIAMIILGKSLILFLLTEKWGEAVPFLQILMIVALVDPFQGLLFNILKVKGKSRTILHLSFVEYILLAVGIVCTYWIGIFALLGSLVVVTLVKFLLTAKYAGGYIDYRLDEQLKDLASPLIYSVFAGGFVFLFLHHVSFSQVFTAGQSLLIGILCFSSIYVLLCRIFKSEVQEFLFVNAWQFFKNLVKGR